MTETLLTALSLILTLAHALGGILITRGVLTLLGGVKGKGQSSSGVNALRSSISTLLAPLLIPLASLAFLIALTYLERSPLTLWIQVIAPLSTSLWVIWGHYSAKKVEPGALFEALFPLAIPLKGKDMLTKVHMWRAKEWSSQGHDLSVKSFVRTAIRAIDDERGSNRESLTIDQVLKILRDSFQEVHQALSHFPLAKTLTLADWVYEIDRLGEIWSSGLDEIDRGRAFVNPLTLLDHQSLWKWSSAQPKDLLNRELSAWLHLGVYCLVTRRVIDHFGVHVDGTGSTSSTDEHRTELLDESRSYTPLLWLVLTRKLTVPMGLYFILSSVALTLEHGLFGSIFCLAIGGVIVHNVQRSLSLDRWRAALDLLSKDKREQRVDLSQVKEACLVKLKEAEDLFNKEFDSHPAMSTLKFLGNTAELIAYEHRRPEHHQAPLALCNVYVCDVALTAQLICDDLIDWRSEGGLFSMIITAISKLGISIGNVDDKLMASLNEWAKVSETADEDRRLVTAETPTFIVQKAQAADVWIKEKRAGLGFFSSAGFTMASSYAQDAIRDKCSAELSSRVLALYQGEVKNHRLK